MTSTQDLDGPIRLRAFVGRSFHDNDRQLWHDLRDILDSVRPMGFRYEDAKVAQLRPISQKVRELILRNEIYIGVLSQRFPVFTQSLLISDRLAVTFGTYRAARWSTSEWVIEEVGFALGHNKPVLLLVEEGVIFPDSDLDADTQWIRFQRDKIAGSHTEISQMILGLIAKRVPGVELVPATAAPAVSETATPVQPEKPPFGARYATFVEHIRAERYADAADVQRTIVAEIATTEADNALSMDALLLGRRARRGDSKALEELKSHAAKSPPNGDYVRALASVYSSYEQHDASAKLLVSYLSLTTPAENADFATRAAEALCKNGEGPRAIHILLKSLRAATAEATRVDLQRALANTAGEMKDDDLEAALLERLLQDAPMNNNVRFRLAYVYDETERSKLAAYHYGLLTTHTDWPSAFNNLAATYARLSLTASEVAGYEKVADSYPLARANLANIYASAGFLPKAREIATATLSTTENEGDGKLAIARARAALEEVNKMEKSESEAIAKLSDETRAERDFMASFADAFCTPPAPDFEGTYTFSHGDILLRSMGQKITGSASFKKAEPLGALGALITGHTPEPRTTLVNLKLAAQLTGRAGTYTLNIDTATTPRTVLGESQRKISGLVYIGTDEKSLHLLEQTKATHCS